MAQLQWQAAMGADEVLEHEPQNRLVSPPPVMTAMPQASAPSRPVPQTAAQARSLAGQASTLEELKKAVCGFDGCSLKKTATKTVFADGNPKSKLMLIGEAPGEQEDLQGIPFCGASGKLLDTMVAAISYDRTTFYITNTIFWRPPGNRKPSPEELAICRPFVEKHIALVNPELIVLVGGTAMEALLNTTSGITKMRGKTYQYTNQYLAQPIPVMVTFHPSYLLRQPLQKRQAWHDWLAVKHFLVS